MSAIRKVSRLSRRVRWAVAMVFLCAAAPETYKGWGESVDPDGDCKFVLEKDRLTIKVPGTLHDLNVRVNNLSAPRVLEEVRGDWTAKVEISGRVSHQGETVSPMCLSYHGAGLLAWKDDQTFIRLERAALFTPEGQPLHYISFEVRRDGRMLDGGSAVAPDKPTFLRLVRRGDKLIGSYSADGKKWTKIKTMETALPNNLKVGVVAVCTSKEPFNAQFERYSVLRTKVAGKAKP